MRFSHSIYRLYFITLLVINLVLLLLVLSHFISSRSLLSTTTKIVWDSPLEKHFSTLIDNFGAEKAYTTFKQETAKTEINIQHTAAHTFGTVLYKKIGVKGVTVCDSTFAFGCYHSFFAQAIADKGIDSITALDKECTKKYSVKGLGCVHGIGHGIIYYLGKNHLDEALSQCTRLSWKGPVGGCTSGVFMEFNLNTMNNPSGNSTGLRPFTETKKHSPCTEVAEQFRRACYFEMPQWWVMTLGGKTDAFKKAGTFCHEITDDYERNTCFMGLGNVAGPMTRFNASLARTYCGTIEASEEKMYCQAGASWSFRIEEKFRDLSPSLCADLAEDSKQKCLSLAQTFL